MRHMLPPCGGCSGGHAGFAVRDPTASGSQRPTAFHRLEQVCRQREVVRNSLYPSTAGFSSRLKIANVATMPIFAAACKAEKSTILRLLSCFGAIRNRNRSNFGGICRSSQSNEIEAVAEPHLIEPSRQPGRFHGIVTRTSSAPLCGPRTKGDRSIRSVCGARNRAGLCESNRRKAHR